MAETVADIVKVIFEASGTADVAKAFESIESRMGRFERSASQSAASGVRERVRAATQERKEREALYAAMFKEIDAKEKAASKSTEKAARDKAKAEASSARERLHAEESLARSKMRIIENSARYAGRLAEQQANDEIRAMNRVARERERVQKQSQARNARIGGSVGGIVGGSFSRVVGGAGMIAGAALAIGGGASFADSIRDELGAEKAAAILSNSAYIRGAAGASGVRVDPSALLAKAKGIQALTNVSKADVLAGMQSFVAKTGSAEILGENDTSVLEAAKLSKATGANFADVMSASGILRAQNKNMTTAQSSEMLRNVVAQGKLGAVEMTDLASIAGKITASSAMYAGDQNANQRKLLALSQIVYPVAGSADETATSITHLGADALKHRGQLAGLGLFDEHGMIKGGPESILTKVLGATGGNLGKIQSLGFGERSIRAFEALATPYQDALAKSHGDSKAAMGIIGAQIGQYTNASMSQKDVENDLSVVMQGRAEKIDAAMMRLKEILADKGVPLFERFVNQLDNHLPDIERFLGKIADLADWFASNPFEGIGALVMASIAKDLAGAAIGEGVKRALIAALNGGSSLAANPRGLLPTGVGLKPANGSIVAAAGAGIVALTVAGALDVAQGIDTATDARSRGQREALGASAQLGNIDRALKAGQISPEAAKKAIASAQSLIEKGQSTGAGDAAQASVVGGRLIDSAGAALGLGSSVTGVTAAGDRIGEAAGIRDGEKQLIEAIKSLTKTVEAKGSLAGGGNMSEPNNPQRRQPNAPPVAQ